MKCPTIVLLAALWTASLVDAHGFLYTVTIDGVLYRGNYPGTGNPSPSIIRQVSDISPVKGASNPDLRCGLSSTVAQLVANANPGSTVSFYWSGGNYQNWPHNTGPLLTYMTNCGSTPCNQFNPDNSTKWFKIEEIAREPNGTWAQAILQAGGQLTITLPATLAAGNYLIRNEIIALQNAVAEGGAEFYPACAQLHVGGSQTGVPNPSELTTFPGAYSDTDPGILDPSVYDPGSSYVIPGPPVAAFAVSSGNGTTTDSSPSGNTGSSQPTQTATQATGTPGAAPTSTPSGNCQLKRNVAVKRDQTQLKAVPLTKRKHDLTLAMRTFFSGRHRHL